MRRLALLILLCATAAFGQMPMGGITGSASGGGGGGFSIAHDADSANIACGNVSTCTVPITVGAGAHNAVLLRATCDAGFSGCSISNVTDTTNSAVLTCTTASSGSPSFVKLFLCITTGVPSGANSIVITLTGAPGTATFGAAASSYTGVNQATPFDVAPATFINLGNVTSISENVTTLTANAWIVDAVSVQESNGTAATVTSPQVARWNNPINSAVVGGASDNGPIATPGTVSDGWSYSAAANWFCFITAALKAG